MGVIQRHYGAVCPTIFYHGGVHISHDYIKGFIPHGRIKPMNRALPVNHIQQGVATLLP
jgi:hypothetical protein